jgi:hypothetical protein
MDGGIDDLSGRTCRGLNLREEVTAKVGDDTGPEIVDVKSEGGRSSFRSSAKANQLGVDSAQLGVDGGNRLVHRDKVLFDGEHACIP